MYCIIQYMEICNNVPEIEKPKSVESKQSLQAATLNSPGIKTLMVNPNCPMQILLDYICSEVGIDKNSNYDLCDYETGELLGIKQHKPWSYATTVLKLKQTYVIAFYDKDDLGQYNKLELLMNKQSKQYSEILLRIKRQISTMKRTKLRKTKKGNTSSKTSTSDSVTSHREFRNTSRTKTEKKNKL